MELNNFRLSGGEKPVSEVTYHMIPFIYLEGTNPSDGEQITGVKDGQGHDGAIPQLWWCLYEFMHVTKFIEVHTKKKPRVHVRSADMFIRSL